MTENPLLSVKDLRTVFSSSGKEIVAVDGVSFDLRAGEIVGLVGESGSGKSLTGFSILGLIDPPGRIGGGSVVFEGRELVGLNAREMRAVRGRQIAMVFQDPSTTLNPVLTIFAQMKLALQAHQRISDEDAHARCVEVLDQVGMPDPQQRLRSYPHEFSGGMRQRVAIAIALLNRPKVIICDEPTTALDVSIQAQILSEMKGLAATTGTALIWISHDLATVSSIADRVMVMYAGRIVEEGPVSSVLGSPRHPYTMGLLNSLPSSTAPGEDLKQIPGSTPSLFALPSGCSFSPRCERASVECGQQPAATRSGTRAFRCHHPISEPVRTGAA